jgi:hypothetical protein
MMKLTKGLRGEIVARFANWGQPREIQSWLKAEHGVDVGLPGLSRYNFDNPLARANGTPEWVELFDELRAAAVEHIAAIPIAHRVRRLQISNDLVERMHARVASSSGAINVVLVEKILQQLEYAAKEVGGFFTNRQEITGANGGPIATRDASLDHMTNEDLVELAQSLLTRQPE